MHFLLKVFWVLARCRICNPEKNYVVVFDRTGSEILEKLILDNIKHTILPVRYELFYISPRIIVFFIKNFLQKYLRYYKYRSLYFIYLLSCIEYISPKVVITFIDNNSFFYAISEVYEKAIFYAIQNGCRNKYSLAKPLRPGSSYSMPNFICFGRYETDLYRQYGRSVNKFHPVGSLIGGYYRSQISENKLKCKFDLCLVSIWRKHIMIVNPQIDDVEKFYFKNPILILDEYLPKFVEESGLSLCIATCSPEREEIDYFKRIYGDRAQIINCDRLNFSTYAAMDNSYIILTTGSTVAYEAFGWGKKVLFCNFSKDRNYNFEMDGFWSINNCCYDTFKKQLNYLIKVDDQEYARLTKEFARYVMNYDFSMPPHNYIRKIITQHVSS